MFLQILMLTRQNVSTEANASVFPCFRMCAVITISSPILAGDMYVMFMSTLTPGAPLSVHIRAMVEMLSTKVAVKPPWSVPSLLVCCSSTFISQISFSGAAETSVTFSKTLSKPGTLNITFITSRRFWVMLLIVDAKQESGLCENELWKRRL